MIVITASAMYVESGGTGEKANATTAIANDTLRHKIDYVEVLNSAL